MKNFFQDNPDLQFHFNGIDLEEAVGNLEHQYAKAESDENAPADYQSAIDSYAKALDQVGDLAAGFIAPRSPRIDEEGASLQDDGKVRYAKGSEESYQALAKAGFTGAVLPRQHGGCGFPSTIYFMMVEMVARADASLITLFGYQDIGETICHFGSEKQMSRFIPKYAAGEHIAAMALTEPEAGSDLQSVQLLAYQDGNNDDQWTLRGTKHLISNGGAELLLVLARSQPETEGLFGLSLFATHANGHVDVKRVEEKMGINGSPTCELYFNDCPAELIGRKGFGMSYVLFALNQARFSVSAQALGIAEAAYAEADKFAREREQFGAPIIEIPAVVNMLFEMRVAIEVSRSMLYHCAQWLDLKNTLEEQIAELKAAKQPFAPIKQRAKKLAKIIDLLSPMVKYLIPEMAVSVCYDAQQLHGGRGYLRGATVERLARDVRITTIYEGTSQIQIAACFKSVQADLLADFFDECAARETQPELTGLKKNLEEIRTVFLQLNDQLNECDDATKGIAARNLVDVYSFLFGGYLLLGEAGNDTRKSVIARHYIGSALAETHRVLERVSSTAFTDLETINDVIKRAD